MKFSELPIEVQEKLNAERFNLINNQINTPYEVLLYNRAGTRFFHARRYQDPYHNGKGGYLPFGGGSQWRVEYGCMCFSREKQPIGYDYEVVKGKTFEKSANGTVIHPVLKTKKEVLFLAREIGIFYF